VTRRVAVVALLAACAREAPAPRSLVDAVRDDSLGVLIAKLDAGWSPDSAAPDGARPLTEAARLGRSGMLLDLLDADADPALTDAQGNTPFALAVAGNHRDAIDLLLRDAVTRAGGGPPVQAWLDRVRDGAEATDDWTRVLSGELLSLGLAYAALHDRPAVVDALRASHDLPNATGWRALPLAAHLGRGVVVSVLLAGGAEPDQVRTDGTRRSALAEAIVAGHADIARQLVRAGARLDQPDASGTTPRELARASANPALQALAQR
jgi:uncharacterized protein